MIIVKNSKNERLYITKNINQFLINTDDILQLTVTENGEYTPPYKKFYNNVSVNVNGNTFFDGNVDEEGLQKIGWNETDINEYADNTPHPSYINNDYIVSEENKQLYSIVNYNNVYMYKDSPNFVYCPKFETKNYENDYYTQLFYGSKYLRGVPKFDTSEFEYFNDFFYDCPNLTTAPEFNYNKAKTMEAMFSQCRSLQNAGNIVADYCQDMSFLFNNCTSLVYAPNIQTRELRDMNYMFNGCSTLRAVPKFETKNVRSMDSAFANCTMLKYVPKFDTGNVRTIHRLFYNCSNLEIVPELNTTNVTNVNSAFYNCSKLVSIPLLDFGNVTSISQFFGTNNNFTITDLGGFKNLKIDWNDNYGLADLQKLTYQSVINILNNLYDFRGNGDTTTTRTIKFSAKSKGLLSDEDIAIATNKGWIIS
jgi:hypothetical protein